MEKIIEVFTLEMGDGFFAHLLFHYSIVFLLFLVPIVLSFADLGYAVSTARKLGERIRSHKLRKTVEKILLYWGLQLVSAVIGSIGVLFAWYNLPYLTMFATVVIAVIEVKSLVEHFRRRKDHLSKVPETVQEIIEFVGGESEFKELIKNIAHKEGAQQ